MARRRFTKRQRKGMRKSRSIRGLKGGAPTPPTEESISDENAEFCIFETTNISTEPSDLGDEYKKSGILHFTDSGSINALRQLATGFVSIFGRKGFDNIIYDKIRNAALKKLDNLLEKKKNKMCNMRMEFDTDGNDTIFIHIYGTLYKSDSAPEEEPPIEEDEDSKSKSQEEPHIEDNEVSTEDVDINMEDGKKKTS